MWRLRAVLILDAMVQILMRETRRRVGGPNRAESHRWLRRIDRPHAVVCALAVAIAILVFWASAVRCAVLCAFAARGDPRGPFWGGRAGAAAPTVSCAFAAYRHLQFVAAEYGECGGGRNTVRARRLEGFQGGAARVFVGALCSRHRSSYCAHLLSGNDIGVLLLALCSPGAMLGSPGGALALFWAFKGAVLAAGCWVC